MDCIGQYIGVEKGRFGVFDDVDEILAENAILLMRIFAASYIGLADACSGQHSL
jgi:hypothetical protein